MTSLFNERLLRNNRVIVLAAKKEGAPFNEIEWFLYDEDLIDRLRREGYVIFHVFGGLFTVDDKISTPYPEVLLTADERDRLAGALKEDGH